jgi:hypothetical protein
MLISLRIEFIVLVVLLPFVILFAQKRQTANFKINNELFLKWVIAYFSPLAIVFIFFTFMPNHKAIGDYNSVFAVAYCNLSKESFSYENSKYPELLKEYRGILETGKTTCESMAVFYQKTNEYLSNHSELKMSPSKMLDRVYVEIMVKNTFSYAKTFITNLKNHLLGIAEIDSLVIKYRSATGAGLFDIFFWIFNVSTIIFYKILFVFFILSLPLLFLKRNHLPYQAFIAFWVSAIHIFVLAFLTNPAHRFRYELDPFIYFIQFYAILALLKWLICKVNYYSIKVCSKTK